jgi:hypothetical protein
VGEDTCDFTLGSFEIVEDRWSSQDRDDGSDNEPVDGNEWFEDGDSVDVWTVQGQAYFFVGFAELDFLGSCLVKEANKIHSLQSL